ncbi:MAG: protein phosphatase 2C domain-containing protein [Sporichthyaceae bacterium]|nr:protein phosphatase 2C domain-containing protein [Sporichthyaceae bacterium]
MPLTLRFTARSHVGLVREGNEDSGYAGARLLVVADGMGGHAAGEVASAAAISALVELDAADVADPRTALAEALVEADRRLRILVEDDSARDGMGTTLTALFWDGKAFTLAHVGDSRAYFLRDGQLGQITHDHTFVQTLVDEGRISADEAETHPQRSLILRTVDGRGRGEPDLDVIEAYDGDRFLVCSDGLSGFVSVEDMTAATGLADLDTAADRLIELALDAGAPDNVTLVLAQVYDSDDTGVLPPLSADGQLGLTGMLVGAAAEPDAPWSAAASNFTPQQPDRRLPDPEDDSAENEAEVARYAPQAPSRFRWARQAGLLLVAVAVLAGLAFAGQQWTRTQYYVGVEGEQVAIYQGINQRVLGVKFSEVHEVLDVPVEMLPNFDQTEIAKAISADSLDDARSIANRLGDRAAACERFRGEPARLDPTPTEAPTASPDSTVATSPSPDPSGGTSGPGTPSTQPTDQPTSAPTSSSQRSSPDPRPSESGEPSFDDPVTREECGVNGS